MELSGFEWLIFLFFPLLPLVIVLYVVVLLRDIRSGIRRLNDRTDAIDRKLEHGAAEHS